LLCRIQLLRDGDAADLLIAAQRSGAIAVITRHDDGSQFAVPMRDQ
jgi:hypothetical protein